MVKAKAKPEHLKGKISLSRYFQEISMGQHVAFVRDLSVPAQFPVRMQGRTGVISGRRGKVYSVRVNDKNQEKTFLVQPIHLKKIKIVGAKA